MELYIMFTLMDKLRRCNFIICIWANKMRIQTTESTYELCHEIRKHYLNGPVHFASHTSFKTWI